MLASCSPKLLARVTRDDDVITDQELVILQVQPSSSQNEESDKERPTVPLDANCCCVVYTSGSTGDPKGVQCAGSAVLNIALGQVQCFKLCQDDVTAQFVSVGFDANLSEIFTAFLSRGTLAVLYEDERDGDEFIRIMKLLKVTVITIPASLLDRTTYTRSDFPELKKIITVGEECTTETARKWTQDQDLLFFNVYGTSETTGCATVYEYQRDGDTEVQNSSLPINLATASTTRILTFHGRMDDQVNSMGQTVNLSGLERRICRCPGVERATVVKHQVDGGDTTIAAFVAPQCVLQADVKHFLKELLSVHEIPSHIKMMNMDDFPLNANVDKFALSRDAPIMIIMMPALPNGGCTHMTENQNTVAQIWCEVLNLSDEVMDIITPETTFTDVGGNSLQVLRLQRTIENKWWRVITTKDILRAQTLEALTKIIFEPSEQRQ